jgi:hypothetical protein
MKAILVNGFTLVDVDNVVMQFDDTSHAKEWCDKRPGYDYDIIPYDESLELDYVEPRERSVHWRDSI